MDTFRVADDGSKQAARRHGAAQPVNSEIPVGWVPVGKSGVLARFDMWSVRLAAL